MPASCRKMSCATLASSSDEESNSAAPSSDSSWCQKCEVFWRTCNAQARDNGFKLIGGVYAAKLSFSCPEKGHLTKISYSRRLNAGPLSCSACKKEERDAQKNILRAEEERQNAHLAEMQEEMFRQAQAAMDDQMRSEAQPSFQRGPSTDYSTLEAQINEQATTLTSAYLRESVNSGVKVTQEQTYLVYKFLNTPIEMLVQGMVSMDHPSLSQFYRKLAKQLHPDKNSHPEAKAAFQRVQEALETAKVQIPAPKSPSSC